MSTVVAPELHTSDLINTASAQAPEGFDGYVATIALTSPGLLSRTVRADDIQFIHLESTARGAVSQVDHQRRMFKDEAMYIGRIRAIDNGNLAPDAVEPVDSETDPELEGYREQLATSVETAKRAGQDLTAFTPEALASRNLQEKRARLGRFAGFTAFLSGAVAAGALASATFLGANATFKGDVPVESSGHLNLPAVSVRVTDGSNPLSRHFILTGEELGEDEHALRPVISHIAGLHEHITGAIIVGLSSDEINKPPNMGIGRRNEENHIVASLRAETGKQALIDAARKDHLNVEARDLHNHGKEVVLDRAEVHQLDNAAASIHESSDQMITQYDSPSSHLPARVRTLLNKYLGDNRGVKFRIDVQGIKRVLHQNTFEKFESIKLAPDFTIVDAMIGAVALSYGLFSGALFTDRIAGRFARRRALHQMRAYQHNQQHAQDA